MTYLLLYIEIGFVFALLYTPRVHKFISSKYTQYSNRHIVLLTVVTALVMYVPFWIVWILLSIIGFFIKIYRRITHA